VKLAVMGKGGSGKTTTAAVLARCLARDGLDVVALDCDTNPNLGISLGVGDDETERLAAMRQALDEGDEQHAPGWDDLLDRYGALAPDGVRLAVVSRIDNPEPGCPCCGLSPEQLLGSVAPTEAVVIADLEAGIGTMTRLEVGVIDVACIVVQPTPKSIEVGRRAVDLAGGRDVGRIVIVANRVRHHDDLAMVREAFPGTEVVAVPDHPAFLDADRRGVAPVDAAPDSPGVVALEALARLVGEPLPSV
jgi:CO dehydrogenase maturation factor